MVVVVPLCAVGLPVVFEVPPLQRYFDIVFALGLAGHSLEPELAGGVVVALLEALHVLWVDRRRGNLARALDLRLHDFSPVVAPRIVRLVAVCELLWILAVLVGVVPPPVLRPVARLALSANFASPVFPLVSRASPTSNIYVILSFRIRYRHEYLIW